MEPCLEAAPCFPSSPPLLDSSGRLVFLIKLRGEIQKSGPPMEMKLPVPMLRPSSARPPPVLHLYRLLNSSADVCPAQSGAAASER
ncbi:hypothetical protein EYF80_020051 [Liparis tanakae]|uniref:Uncharacterized protein n=1 Tax=Liparis tanakae TaxID=230148 RepID=A0A4Z2HVG3_9TELE|nr:hypothetical protein EYF80_020051 [Liparis tanakae]